MPDGEDGFSEILEARDRYRKTSHNRSAMITTPQTPPTTPPTMAPVFVDEAGVVDEEVEVDVEVEAEVEVDVADEVVGATVGVAIKVLLSAAFSETSKMRTGINAPGLRARHATYMSHILSQTTHS